MDYEQRRMHFADTAQGDFLTVERHSAEHPLCERSKFSSDFATRNSELKNEENSSKTEIFEYKP